VETATGLILIFSFNSSVVLSDSKLRMAPITDHDCKLEESSAKAAGQHLSTTLPIEVSPSLRKR
jgi:hypothetical protein